MCIPSRKEWAKAKHNVVSIITARHAGEILPLYFAEIIVQILLELMKIKIAAT